MIQDLAGVYLLSRNPLQLLMHIKGQNMYESKFSADSESFTTVTLPLTYTKWSLADRRKVEARVLDISGGCIDAAISNDGAFLGCYRSDFSFGLFDLSADVWVYSEANRTAVLDRMFARVPFGADTAYPGPVGFFISGNTSRFAHSVVTIPIHFSPDGQTLLAGNETDAFRLNLATRKKESLSRAIQKRLADSMILLDAGRALAAGGTSQDVAMLSVTAGTMLQKFPHPADFLRATGNPRYAVLYTEATSSAVLFDLQQGRSVDLPPLLGAAVHENEIATVNADGQVSLFMPAKNIPSQT